ncbi:MAG TPA: hypothetical protein VL358_02190 [Caulobacteraceae bacterium]|jgi:hypothetical protein|nr:hypothetical protein [Caulobacteraceae bacterium]
MVRMATAAAILVLSAGTLGARAAWAADGRARDVATTERRLAAAEADYEAKAYDSVVRTLAPTVVPEVYATLPEAMQYEALGLFARALYRLGAYQDAHEAFVSLTAHPDATVADWALRAETAERIGDLDDADTAREELQGPEIDDAPSTAA